MDKPTQIALQKAASLNFTIPAFLELKAPRSRSMTKTTNMAKAPKNKTSFDIKSKLLKTELSRNLHKKTQKCLFFGRNTQKLLQITEPSSSAISLRIPLFLPTVFIIISRSSSEAESISSMSASISF